MSPYTPARKDLREALWLASGRARVLAGETHDRAEGLRLESLADTIDAERRMQGEKVVVPVRTAATEY